MFRSFNPTGNSIVAHIHCSAAGVSEVFQISIAYLLLLWYMGLAFI